MMEKKAMRKEFKAKRQQLKKTSPSANNIIFNNLIKEDMFKEANCIFCYISFGTEIDTSCIIDYILASGKKLVVPKCTTDSGDMIAVEIKSRDELRDGMYGIMEPILDTPCEKKNIDLAIIPALAFDKSGFRLGYGKGYYDRFLEGISPNALKILIAFDAQKTDEVAMEETDVRMDLVVTEKGITAIRK